MRADIAANFEKLPLVPTREGDHPQFPFTAVDELIAGRIKHGRLPFANYRDAAGAAIDHRHFLLRACRISSWVRVFTGRVFALLITARISNRTPVWCKDQTGQLAAVILVIMCELSRRKRRRFGNPDVPLTFGIEGPGDFVASFRG